MPVPAGATRVTYRIASSSVDQPLEMTLPVEIAGSDIEGLDSIVEEAMDLVLARIRAARPGDQTLSTTRLYYCTLQDGTWPAA
ncbi:hypothetical protein ABT007_00945 [Streptomyces griseus]|uniref:hypothetical protein n=1 Tax=Streptomyces griseus TaxID=1911 RepID=UPI00331E5163